MPPPKEDWKNWSRIPEFKKYAEKAYQLKTGSKITEFDPSLKYRGEIMGITQVQNKGRVKDPLTMTGFDVSTSQHKDKVAAENSDSGQLHDYTKANLDMEYQSHPFDSLEYEKKIDVNFNSKKQYYNILQKKLGEK